MGFSPTITKESKPIYVAGVEASLDYFNSQYVRTKSPKIKLLLTPFMPPLMPMELLSQDMGGIILSCSVQKSRNMAHGSWTVTMAADDSILDGYMNGWPLSAIWQAAGRSLRDIFKPMTLTQLWLDGYHVMTGVVRVCRKQTRVGSKTYTVQFDELGVIYTQKIMSMPQITKGQDEHLISNPDIKWDQFQSNPAENLDFSIKKYFQAYMASTLNYSLNDPLSFFSGSDLLPLSFRMINENAPLGAISNSSIMARMPSNAGLLNSGGQTFWDFMKSYATEPFMEMFCETGGRTICTGKLIQAATAASAFTGIGSVAGLAAGLVGVPPINITPMLPGFNYLVMRTSPYDNPLHGITGYMPVLFNHTLGVMDLILAGDFIIITDDDVIEKDLGVSDIQQYTSFSVNMTGQNASDENKTSIPRPSYDKGPFLPIFSGGTKTFGIRSLMTSFEGTSTKDLGILSENLEAVIGRIVNPGIYPLATLLNTWFRNASKFNEGTITTRGIPYARPGMVLLYLPSLRTSDVDDPRDIGVYYIDNHTYDYELGKVDRSTFTVIRGTPLPFTMNNLLSLLLEWNVLPVGLNLTDIMNGLGK